MSKNSSQKDCARGIFCAMLEEEPKSLCPKTHTTPGRGEIKRAFHAYLPRFCNKANWAFLISESNPQNKLHVCNPNSD